MVNDLDYDGKLGIIAAVADLHEAAHLNKLGKNLIIIGIKMDGWS